MLVQLNIKNFAIIEEIKINFTKGLNIITGETGAGKSILIEALGIILGSRSSKEYIQSGYDKAVLEGVFYIGKLPSIKPILDEYSIDIGEDNLLIITKEIHLNGPSLSNVNGRNLTLNMLKKITNKLVDIFGQHEHQSLLNISNHQVLVDSFGDKNFFELKKKVNEIYSQWSNQREKLKRYSIDSGAMDREIDIIKYQMEEINEARLTHEDDNSIENEYKKLSNIEDISESIQKSLSYINNEDHNNYGILGLINNTIYEINNAKNLDKNLEKFHSQFVNINFEIQDLYVELRDYLDNIDLNMERLNFLLDRINLVNKLKKKYGNNINEVLLFRDKIENRLNELLNFEEEYENANGIIERLEKELKLLSEQLTDERKKLSEILEKRITEELNTLNMKDVIFKVNFSKSNNYTLEGQDKIEFLISTNPGEKLKPLAKIVSGGEMSRIMLGFKSIIAFSEQIPTLIFDEIDTGISGRTAQIVGEKIHKISREHQVICISHLPQIAALADSHFSINKITSKNKSITTISKLSEIERIEELARLLGGVNLTNTTVKHAKEMIEMSNKIKKI